MKPKHHMELIQFPLIIVTPQTILMKLIDTNNPIHPHGKAQSTYIIAKPHHHTKANPINITRHSHRQRSVMMRHQ
jgi:hypothetical protein